MILAVIILSLYAGLLAVTIYGFVKTPAFQNTKTSAKTNFSVIIPYKNEVNHLPALLRSIEKINYPNDLFEIILVDDHSTDDSYEIVLKSNAVKSLKNTGTGKKAALETGIKQAKNSWIITTDADCILPAEWLKTFDDFIKKLHPKMVLGSVKYFDSFRFIDQFQQFEFLSLQAFTVAFTYLKKPFLANGANLAFEKQAFFKVRAYEGNKNIASGDDVFLLEKFAKAYPGKIHFLKSSSAIVQTAGQPTMKSLFQQKIRWASKNKYQKSIWTKTTGIIIMLTNIILIFNLLNMNWWFISIKLFFDIGLLLSINHFYKTRLNWWYFIASFMIYPLYLIFVALMSLKGNYMWKGRKIDL